MKTTGTGFAPRALLALLTSATLCATSRAAPQSTEPGFSLGIETQALSDAWRMRAGYRGGGVVVTDVAAGSSAARAGLKPGDILVSVGWRALRNPGDLRVAETAVERGSRVPVVVARDAGRAIRVLNITDAEVVGTSAATRPATAEFGIRCENLGLEQASELGAPEGFGVLVRHVNGGSTAEAAGIAAGDMVTFAGGKPVSNVDELEAIIINAPSPLAIVTVRGGTTHWLTAEFVTPTPPVPGAEQPAGAEPAKAVPSSETAAVDPAADPALDSGAQAPATAAESPPAAVAPVSSATTGSETASEARIAALQNEVLSLREEVRKLREEIAKLAR